MKPTRIRLLSLTLATSACIGLAAVPADAQHWRTPHRTPQKAAVVRSQINGLASDVNRAQRRGTISRQEARGLRRAVRNLRFQFRNYNRDGLSRQEVSYLQYRANRIRARLRLERFDWNDRRW